MTISINAAAAVRQPRTGVEEYTYQLIKHLTMLPEARKHRFLLYLPSFLKEGWGGFKKKELNPSPARLASESVAGRQPLFEKVGKSFFDFPLPDNFEIKVLRWPLPFLWTQIRLAWEVWRRPPDVLFIPVHILPFGAPKNSVVTIHGLEYEYFPEHYPLWHRWYLRWSTKRAVKRAAKVIAISANTKQDLIKLYGAEPRKIEVVHHGVSFCHSGLPPRLASGEAGDPESRSSGSRIKCGMTTIEKPYFLYIGRVETKKNIQGLLEAYEILKEKYNIPHQLVLAGASGYGYDKKLKTQISSASPIPTRVEAGKVVELGYVADEKKRQLLAGADIFLFLSFYEGFGLSVLEAQATGVPVVCSEGSSLREIAGQGALLVNPRDNLQIAEAIKQVIDDNVLRDKLRQSGFENLKRFSWKRCAKATLEELANL